MRKLLSVLALAAVALSVAVAGGTVTIKGSDTLVRLGQRWAEEYMKTHKAITVQVSGGGSGTGIAALINGTTDVCEASRDMQPKEYKLAEGKGIKPFRVAVALDGIAVFLNKANPVKELTLPQLKNIYTGKLTNWKDVGGNDATIILYSRENNSGTYAFFKEHVMKGMDYAPQTQNLPGTASVVNAVSKDPNGIGYGGIAWESNVKAAAVKMTDTSAAVEPSITTVTNGTYPISRELYWFFNGTPSGDLKDLLNWALSPEGQKIAEEIDYIPLPKDIAVKNMVK